MGKKYKNPPVIETLCEFQFIPSHSWDLTIPGLIYDKLKKEYPDRKQQLGLGIQFQPTEKGFEHKVEPAPPRIQFYNKDKTALIQIAPDLLVINRLKPYITWTKFKPLILEAFNVYREIAAPKGFKRIGLRYINKINIETESIELSEYVNFYPFLPKDLPQFHTSFLSRVEIPHIDGRDRLLITIGSVLPDNPKITSIVLDLDYILAVPERIYIKEFLAWLEVAHSVIENSFESCITEKCRKLFMEEM